MHRVAFHRKARQEGIEPPTWSLEGSRSIHLSYWRRFSTNALSFSWPAPSMSFASRPIGAAGFEPATSCSQSRRDTGLRYAPRIEREC